MILMKISSDDINPLRFMARLGRGWRVVIIIRLFKEIFYGGIAKYQSGFMLFGQGRSIGAFLVVCIFTAGLGGIALVAGSRLRIVPSFIMSGFLVHCSFCTCSFQIFASLIFRIRSICPNCPNSSQATDPYLFIVLPSTYTT